MDKSQKMETIAQMLHKHFKYFEPMWGYYKI